MSDHITNRKGVTDFDILRDLFEKRQERLQAERVVDEAKAHLKLAKEAESGAMDALGGYVPRRQVELAMPRWDGPVLNTDLSERSDIPPEERGRSDDPRPGDGV